MAKLTRKQRDLLAAAAIRQLGNLAEFTSEFAPELAGVDYRLVSAQLATWARRLPGDAWDLRLGDPDPIQTRQEN